MVRPPRSCLEVPRVAERPPPCRRQWNARFGTWAVLSGGWKGASKSGQAARQNARTSAENQLGSEHIVGVMRGVGGRRRPQLLRDLGADEVVGPRERPKEGTTSAVKRPVSVAGSHPQPQLFGSGLPSRARLHVTRLVVQLTVGCPTVTRSVRKCEHGQAASPCDGALTVLSGSTVPSSRFTGASDRSRRCAPPRAFRVSGPLPATDSARRP